MIAIYQVALKIIGKYSRLLILMLAFIQDNINCPEMQNEQNLF